VNLFILTSKKYMGRVLVFSTILSTIARAELIVKVDQPKLAGQKAVIKLTMKNTFKEKVESARAQVFLMDGQGRSLAKPPTGSLAAATTVRHWTRTPKPPSTSS
jgi:hypothetical protein